MPPRPIDWRRSASSDHLYVREREWEAAHTVWLWSDLSPSMNFQSHLCTVTKRDRALVLMLALPSCWCAAASGSALLGLLPPTASRKASSRIAEALAAHGSRRRSTPAACRPTAAWRASPARILSQRFPRSGRGTAERAAAHGRTTASSAIWSRCSTRPRRRCPTTGRAEFLGLEGNERWIADRVERLRAAYQERLAAHRAALAGARPPARLDAAGPPHRPAGDRAAAVADPAGCRAAPATIAGPALHRRDAAGGAGMTLGALAFLSPWLLAGLLALPII